MMVDVGWLLLQEHTFWSCQIISTTFTNLILQTEGFVVLHLLYKQGSGFTPGKWGKPHARRSG